MSQGVAVAERPDFAGRTGHQANGPPGGACRSTERIERIEDDPAADAGRPPVEAGGGRGA